MRLAKGFCSHLGLLVTGLSIALSSGVDATHRLGLGLSVDSTTLKAGTLPSATPLAVPISTVAVHGIYEVPLDQSGLSFSVSPGIFFSGYGYKDITSNIFGVVLAETEYKYQYAGVRLPVMLTKQVDRWLFSGGAYTDVIFYHNRTASGSKPSPTADTKDTNAFMAGLVGQVGYKLNDSDITVGVSLPFTSLYKSGGSSTAIHLGISKTFSL